MFLKYFGIIYSFFFFFLQEHVKNFYSCLNVLKREMLITKDFKRNVDNNKAK